jgi:hypothetical protein
MDPIAPRPIYIVLVSCAQTHKNMQKYFEQIAEIDKQNHSSTKKTREPIFFFLPIVTQGVFLAFSVRAMGITAIEWFLSQDTFASAWCRRWLAIEQVGGVSDVIETALRPLFSPPTRRTLLFTVRRVRHESPTIVMAEDIMSPLWKQMANCATPEALYRNISSMLLGHAALIPRGQLHRYFVLVDKMFVINGATTKKRDRSNIKLYTHGTRITSRGICEPGTTRFQPLDMPRIMCNPHLARTLFRFFLYAFSRDPRFHDIPLAFDFDDGCFFIDHGRVQSQPRFHYRIRESDLRLVLLLLHYRKSHTCIQWSIDSDQLMLGMAYAQDFSRGFFWATDFLKRDVKSFELAAWKREKEAKNFIGPPCVASPHLKRVRHALMRSVLLREEEEEGPAPPLTPAEVSDLAPAAAASSSVTSATASVHPVPHLMLESASVRSEGSLAPPGSEGPVAPLRKRKASPSRDHAAAQTADDDMLIVMPLAFPECETLSASLPGTSFFDASDPMSKQAKGGYRQEATPFPEKLPPLWFNMREASCVLRSKMSIEAFILFCLLNGSDWIKHTELFYGITSERLAEAIIHIVDVMKRNPVQSRQDFEYLLQWTWSIKMVRATVASLEVLRAEYELQNPKLYCHIPTSQLAYDAHRIVKERYPYWRTLQGMVDERERDKLLRDFSSMSLEADADASAPASAYSTQPDVHPVPPPLLDENVQFASDQPAEWLTVVSPDHVADGQSIYQTTNPNQMD